MADTIAATERELYDRAWSIPEYAKMSPGEVFLPAFLDMARPGKSYSILDAGCGAGAGMNALMAAGHPCVSGLDLLDVRQGPCRRQAFTEGSLWAARAIRSDWVYCCDVLEHVPEEFTMLVVARLLEAAWRGVFLSICLEPDHMGALVGEPLHKTVRPFVWWRDRLAELGRIVECRDLLSNGLYLVEPRR